MFFLSLFCRITTKKFQRFTASKGRCIFISKMKLQANDNGNCFLRFKRGQGSLGFVSNGANLQKLWLRKVTKKYIGYGFFCYFAEQKAMAELGNVLRRIIHILCENYDIELLFKFAKVDIKDGFWRLAVSEEDA